MRLPKPQFGFAQNPQTGEAMGMYSKSQMISMTMLRQWNSLTPEEAEGCQTWQELEAKLRAKNGVTDA
jgi:hypothetical protein